MFESLLSWSWLTRYHAGWAAAFFFIIDFGVLSVMNSVDYFLIRGANRPRGHWSFWMVVVFDTILLPVMGYAIARIWQISSPKPTLWGWDIWVSVALGVWVVKIFLTRNPNYEGDWTTGNLAGVYHSAALGLFVQIIVLTMIRGLTHLHPAALPWAALVVACAIIAVGVFLVIDEDAFQLGIPKPNQLLEGWFPRWPKGY